MTKRGLVYLLHFTTPYKHARHYLGATGMTLEQRLAAHRGSGEFVGDPRVSRPAKLIQALLRAGGDFVVADVWETETRAEAFALERRLKRHHDRGQYCSICRPGNRAGIGSGNWRRSDAKRGESGEPEAKLSGS